MEADVYISKNYKDEMIFTNDIDYVFHIGIVVMLFSKGLIENQI